MKNEIENATEDDNPKPFSQRTDEEIRERVRELHEAMERIDIPPDGQVIRMDGGRVALVKAVIYIGEND